MAGKYAIKTEIPVTRSRNEIELILKRYGARAFGFMSNSERAMICFEVPDRENGMSMGVRMMLPMPDPEDPDIKLTPSGSLRTEAQLKDRMAQAERSAWRSLTLLVKAKLEAVESGISTIEREFMPDLICGDGRTLGEHLVSQRNTLRAGAETLVLPGGSE